MTETEAITNADRLVAMALIVVVLAVFGVFVWLLYRLALWAVVMFYGDRWGVQQASVFTKPEPLEHEGD